LRRGARRVNSAAGIITASNLLKLDAGPMLGVPLRFGETGHLRGQPLGDRKSVI
jgi:hypothetical protein